MKITEVKIKKFENGKTKGFASITIDKVLCITGITIVEGKNGLFVSMPQNKDKDGNYHDVVFPLSKEARAALTKKVLEAFDGASDPEDVPFE